MKIWNLKDIIEWDIKNWSKALYFWKRYLPKQKEVQALAIGERNGGLSLWGLLLMEKMKNTILLS